MHCRNYVRILRRLWITLEQMCQEKIVLKEIIYHMVAFLLFFNYLPVDSIGEGRGLWEYQLSQTLTRTKKNYQNGAVSYQLTDFGGGGAGVIG
jgi:hypothetical protein